MGEDIYLDCAASTPTDPAVVQAMTEVLGTRCANPSSIHSAGIDAMKLVELARMRISMALGAQPDELIFTGSATEANNHAIKGAIWASDAPTKHLIVSGIEHPSVLGVAQWLAATGQAELTILGADATGCTPSADVAKALRPDTVLVSLMHANNETGTVQPIAEVAALCADHPTLVHVDAAQSFMKLPLDMKQLGLDLVTINGHKLHGPKGVGALAIRAGVALEPVLHGGGHEMGHRSGTLNVAGIVGFGEAVARYGAECRGTMDALRTHLLLGLEAMIPGLRLHGVRTGSLGNILNVGIPGCQGKWMAAELDKQGIRVSASSACHSTKLTPSHVLLAMGLSEKEADEAFRISLGRFNTIEEIDGLLAAMGKLCSGRAA
jgi:cysteine desulfurase